MVANGYPPYGVHEFPPAIGKIPPHRSDAGAFLLADAFGAARLLYVTDVDGVPDRSGGTRERIAAAELRERPLAELPVDRIVLDLLDTAKHVTEVHLVNGLVRGNVTRALDGERVGTAVTAR